MLLADICVTIGSESAPNSVTQRGWGSGQGSVLWRWRWRSWGCSRGIQTKTDYPKYMYSSYSPRSLLLTMLFSYFIQLIEFLIYIFSLFFIHLSPTPSLSAPSRPIPSHPIPSGRHVHVVHVILFVYKPDTEEILLQSRGYESPDVSKSFRKLFRRNTAASNLLHCSGGFREPYYSSRVDV